MEPILPLSFFVGVLAENVPSPLRLETPLTSAKAVDEWRVCPFLLLSLSSSCALMNRWWYLWANLKFLHNFLVKTQEPLSHNKNLVIDLGMEKQKCPWIIFNKWSWFKSWHLKPSNQRLCLDCDINIIFINLNRFHGPNYYFQVILLTNNSHSLSLFQLTWNS